MNSQRFDVPRLCGPPLPAILSVMLLTWAAVPCGVSGQSLVKGTDQTFEAATWNIEWFGGPNGPTDDARQVANVTSIIQQADIDLWALQEVADEDAFNTMVSDLGSPYEGRLAPTSAQQGLGLAFVFKSDVVQIRRVEEILTAFSADFAGRPPLQLEADISTGGASYRAIFIVVHMKATSELASYNQRAAASTRLKNHVDFTALTSEPVFILGDLNDLLSGSITGGQPSPYKNFVDDPAYDTPTLALQLDGRNTFCGNSSSCSSGSTIDHMILSNEAAPWYVSDSADHFDELLNEISSYVFTTSDHLPVFARFSLTSTGTDQPTTVSGETAVTSVYPNPFTDRVAVRYARARAGTVDVTLYDILGRAVAHTRKEVPIAGTHETTLATPGLASGLYVVRVAGAFGHEDVATVLHR